MRWNTWLWKGLGAIGLAASVAAGCSETPDGDEDYEDPESMASGLGALSRGFQDGVSPTSSYAGSTDTEIRQGSPTSNFGGNTSLNVDGDYSAGFDAFVLVRWDVSSIPRGNVMASASITLRVTDTGRTYQIYELKKPWSEREATWNKATSTTSWESPGANGVSDREWKTLGSLAPSATGSHSITLNSDGVAAVQRWVDNPSSNFGVILAGTGTDGVDFRSREYGTASYRPKLTVAYDPPDSGAPDAGPNDSGPKDSGPIDGGPPDSGTDGGAVVSTEPNLKVAFIGDTATAANFHSVLRLVKDEGADAVVIQGDLTYNGASPAEWFSAIDNEINAAWPGSTAPVTIPYFVAKGNHDTSWGTLGAGLKDRMNRWGITSEHNDPTAINYSVAYKGLKMVMVSDAETSPSRADYVNQRLAGDSRIWRICSWHKNQRATNVGPKGDEMGWAIYENCRNQAAIVAQGHSHTYSRSKTITGDATQIVDSTCSSPFNLCVSPGRHIFFDSSLGGVDTRSLDSTVSSKPYWASTFTGSFGALFIEFNVDGNPRKARGYFKTTGGTIVDPPASSGTTSFVIMRSP